MYESRHQAPIARASFAQRLLRHSFAAVGLLLASLAIGMLGYVVFEHLSWIDAFLNAAMLLGGHGPGQPAADPRRKTIRRTLRTVCGPGIHRFGGVDFNAHGASAAAPVSLG